MTERGKYGLLTEPWIKVLDMSGRIREVSLLQLLGQAGDFRALAGDVLTTLADEKGIDYKEADTKAVLAAKLAGTDK